MERRASDRRGGLAKGLGWVLVALLATAACGTLSVTEEEELGADAARSLRRELDFVRDERVRTYVEEIGARIVAAAGSQPYDFRFHVVNDESLNAFALPAGHIYIHTGIILESADVSELAGVIAHEIGHVTERHVARNYRRQRNTGIFYQLAAIAASIFVGGQAAAGGQLLGELAAVAFVNTFTREAEDEADAFAVEVLPRAGYDPHGLVSFFETLEAQGSANVPEFLSSHPTTENRIERTRALLVEADLPEGLITRDDGKLQIVQRRIELLQRSRRR
ncbi:MAG: M48 family metallopeptidase [Myxococcota bacterium]